MDNAQVYKIIQEVFALEDSHTHMLPFKPTEDGRKAWFAIYDHYLGKQHKRSLKAELQIQWNKLSYTGQRREWTFDKFTNRFIELLTRLNALKSEKYFGISDESALEHLLGAITCKDLYATQQSIYNHIHKYTTASAIHLLSEFVRRQNISAPTKGETRTIASTSGTKRSQPDSKESKPRFYTNEEFYKLSPAERHKIIQARRKQKKQEKKEKRNKKVRIDDTPKDDASTGDSPSETQDQNSGKKSGGPNRHHSALNRQSS
jgi:hypothetical protein